MHRLWQFTAAEEFIARIDMAEQGPSSFKEAVNILYALIFWAIVSAIPIAFYAAHRDHDPGYAAIIASLGGLATIGAALMASMFSARLEGLVNANAKLRSEIEDLRRSVTLLNHAVFAEELSGDVDFDHEEDEREDSVPN
jgi:hypothetical protein